MFPPAAEMVNHGGNRGHREKTVGSNKSSMSYFSLLTSYYFSLQTYSDQFLPISEYGTQPTKGPGIGS